MDNVLLELLDPTYLRSSTTVVHVDKSCQGQQHQTLTLMDISASSQCASLTLAIIHISPSDNIISSADSALRLKKPINHGRDTGTQGQRHHTVYI